MLKKIFIIIALWLSIFSFSENTFSSNSNNCDQEKSPFCLKEKTTSDIKWISWEKDFDKLVFSWVNYLLGFLFLTSVIYWMYWAWNIFSALDDDDKVKNWKTIILRAAIWMVVIFSAYMITDFVVNQFLFWKENIVTQPTS